MTGRQVWASRAVGPQEAYQGRSVNPRPCGDAGGTSQGGALDEGLPWAQIEGQVWARQGLGSPVGDMMPKGWLCVRQPDLWLLLLEDETPCATSQVAEAR